MESPRHAHFPQHDFGQPSGLRKKYLESSHTRIVRQLALSRVKFNLDTVISSHIPGPEIQWDPSYATYQSRVEMLSQLQFPRPQAVPTGFPKVVDAPWVWEGSTFRNDQDYILQLNEKDLQEIDEAVNYFKSKLSYSVNISQYH